MVRKFLGGVANIEIFVGDQLAMTAKTLSASGMTIGNTGEDVRGGQGNQLFGKYYHTSTFDINMTDVMFQLEYFAYQAGSAVNAGADMFTTENVVITGNKGALVGTPIDVDSYGLIGWATVLGEDSWSKVEFVDNAGTYEFDYAAADGTSLCVRYLKKELAGQNIVISANMIPSEVKLVLTGNEFKAGKADDGSDSSKIGEVQIVVPRFQFSGSMEISMTASGVSNSPLAGSALAIDDPTCGSSAGYYAIINELISGANPLDGVFALAVDGGSNIELATAEEKTLTVYAIKKMGNPFIIDNSECTFTSSDAAIATAGANTGLITGVAAGNAVIDVVLTSNPTATGTADVTVV